jgi:hypothetical protein
MSVSPSDKRARVYARQVSRAKDKLREERERNKATVLEKDR